MGPRLGGDVKTQKYNTSELFSGIPIPANEGLQAQATGLKGPESRPAFLAIALRSRHRTPDGWNNKCCRRGPAPEPGSGPVQRRGRTHPSVEVYLYRRLPKPPLRR